MALSKTGGIHHGKVGGNYVRRVSGTLWNQRSVPGGVIPAPVPGWICLPQVWLPGVLPQSYPQYLSVPELPPPDLCDGRNGHAPYTSATYGMVLGNVSVYNR